MLVRVPSTAFPCCATKQRLWCKARRGSCSPSRPRLLPSFGASFAPAPRGEVVGTCGHLDSLAGPGLRHCASQGHVQAVKQLCPQAASCHAATLPLYVYVAASPHMVGGIDLAPNVSAAKRALFTEASAFPCICARAPSAAVRIAYELLRLEPQNLPVRAVPAACLPSR